MEQDKIVKRKKCVDPTAPPPPVGTQPQEEIFYFIHFKFVSAKLKCLVRKELFSKKMIRERVYKYSSLGVGDG